MTQPQNTPAPGAEQSESGASVVSENKFHGRPCKNCGGTLRYKTGHRCVACCTRRKRERRRTDPEYRERQREWCREWYRKKRSDPEWIEAERERAREKHRKQRSDPEYVRRERERDSERLRERRHTDPEWRERVNGRKRENYANLDHIAYYESQLKCRRRKALKAKEKRHGPIPDEG